MERPGSRGRKRRSSAPEQRARRIGRKGSGYAAASPASLWGLASSVAAVKRRFEKTGGETPDAAGIPSRRCFGRYCFLQRYGLPLFSTQTAASACSFSPAQPTRRRCGQAVKKAAAEPARCKKGRTSLDWHCMTLAGRRSIFSKRLCGKIIFAALPCGMKPFTLHGACQKRRTQRWCIFPRCRAGAGMRFTAGRISA